MRIAIVNDLRLAVETLKRVVLSVPGHEIAWVAADGKEAVEKCAAGIPDLVLMDLIMPVMDGVRATDVIMRQSPCAILVVTATVAGNAAKVFEAMGCGALDAVATPVLGEGGRIEGAEELLRKISIIAKLIGQEETRIFRNGDAPVPLPAGAPPPLVAIGASTGGPKAVATILSDLPTHPGAALVVVQHVDQQFAEGLADWLASQTSLPVKIAEEGEQLRIDQVYIAGTNDHLVLDRDLSFHYTPHPRDNPFRPSVDAFFESLRVGWPRKDVAVLLTGMGRDGAAGLLELHDTGWHTIVQDEKTSVVYGMPRAAVELGAADEVLPLDAIAHATLTRIRKRNP